MDLNAIFRGLLGLAILIGFGYLLSNDRKKINWRLIGGGVGLQFAIALLLLWPPMRAVFGGISGFFIQLMNFTREGSLLLFGVLARDLDSYGDVFAVQVLPTIIFISALTSALYYLNVLQGVVYVFAWIMKKTMKLSGAESLAAAANVFVGQTEAPLLVKPYVDKMTRSEIMCLMSGGMATVAGGVFVLYISMLGGTDPEMQKFFGTHLLMASIISAPAAIVAAKLLVPEREKVDETLTFPKDEIGSNLLDAIANGTTQGVKLAVNVAAMVLVFIAFTAMFNFFCKDLIGEWTGLNEKILAGSDGRYEGLTLQYMLGLLCAPVAWIIGVPYGDLTTVGQLLGTKTILNEFIAYDDLAKLKASGQITNMKSILIASYALCGFANIGSIGIQIGGIGVLAPHRRKMLAELGVRALIGGSMACLMTACIAGMLFSSVKF
ncbi:MAG: CNT family concentrative nucleoside transporter [Kiritimatiellia bacterium]|jgi:CNT family concentrative nucleoside transporter